MRTASLQLALATLALIVGCNDKPSSENVGKEGEATEVTQQSSTEKPEIALWQAASNGNVEVVKQHLAAGTSPDEKHAASGSTPLILAALSGHTEVVSLLLDKGADVSIKNNEGVTALHIAAFFAHPGAVKLLLEKGADVDAKNARGETALETVSAPWSQDVENIYKLFAGLLQLKLDLKRIEKTRPEIVALLREHGGKQASDVKEVPGVPVPAGPPSENPDAPAITQDDWPMYNHDVAGTRHNPLEQQLSPETASDIVEVWRFPPKDSNISIGVIHATPAVVNGYVYFGTATFPAFYKLKPDGQLDWVYRLSDPTGDGESTGNEGVNSIQVERGILSSALVTERHVYFGNVAGVFYALDRFTGKEVWKVDTRAADFPDAHQANTFMSSPILVDGKVIVGGGAYEHAHPLDPNYPCCTGRGCVVAFAPDTGELIWKYNVGPEPVKFKEPVVIEDANGKHVFEYGPATGSVWSTPSYDAATKTIFFGTDVQNSPRKPTDDNPKLDIRYSSAVIALDTESGREQWVTQIHAGDIYNHTMSSYDPNTQQYKDLSIGDTPKIYEVSVNGETTKVVGVGCKDGGFYVLRASDGELLEQTPIFQGKPQFPLEPQPDPRMIALPSPIGGIQTGCATDGKRVFTNGIDHLLIGRKPPTGGRVVSIDPAAKSEFWRHDRPSTESGSGDPVGGGIAVAGGVLCFTTTVSGRLVVLNAETGESLKEVSFEKPVWSGPSISRGQIYVGTGSVLFFGRSSTGTLYAFGLPE